jgi:hypothetical protein
MSVTPGNGCRTVTLYLLLVHDSASAGRVSVPRSIARICITVSGTAPPASAKTRKGTTSGPWLSSRDI